MLVGGLLAKLHPDYQESPVDLRRELSLNFGDGLAGQAAAVMG